MLTPDQGHKSSAYASMQQLEALPHYRGLARLCYTVSLLPCTASGAASCGSNDITEQAVVGWSVRQQAQGTTR